MQHVVLLGDSVFDNAAYVPPNTAVIEHLRASLPADWRATLCARDGSVIDDVHAQLSALPDGASHLVLSAGGNDLLAEVAVLGKAVRTVGEGLRLLGAIQARFRDDYERLLRAVTGHGLPSCVCTVYDPRFADAELQQEAMTALCLFNDVIIRQAHRFGLPVIDLRAVCTSDEGYATPIEPSVSGGAKIAHAIIAALLQRDWRGRRTILLPS